MCKRWLLFVALFGASQQPAEGVRRLKELGISADGRPAPWGPGPPPPALDDPRGAVAGIAAQTLDEALPDGVADDVLGLFVDPEEDEILSVLPGSSWRLLADPWRRTLDDEGHFALRGLETFESLRFDFEPTTLAPGEGEGGGGADADRPSPGLVLHARWRRRREDSGAEGNVSREAARRPPELSQEFEEMVVLRPKYTEMRFEGMQGSTRTSLEELEPSTGQGEEAVYKLQYIPEERRLLAVVMLSDASGSGEGDWLVFMLSPSDADAGGIPGGDGGGGLGGEEPAPRPATASASATAAAEAAFFAPAAAARAGAAPTAQEVSSR